MLDKIDQGENSEIFALLLSINNLKFLNLFRYIGFWLGWERFNLILTLSTLTQWEENRKAKGWSDIFLVSSEFSKDPIKVIRMPCKGSKLGVWLTVQTLSLPTQKVVLLIHSSSSTWRNLAWLQGTQSCAPLQSPWLSTWPQDWPYTVHQSPLTRLKSYPAAQQNDLNILRSDLR